MADQQHQPTPWKVILNAMLRPIIVDVKGNRVLLSPENIDHIAASANAFSAKTKVTKGKPMKIDLDLYTED